MERLVWFTTVLLCLPLSGFSAELLRWDDPNKPGDVKAFIICAAGPLPAATIRKVTVWTNELDLTYLLKNAPKGRYAVYGMSIRTNDVQSERSKAMVVHWADGKILEETPSTARSSAAVSECEKVAYSHEGKGVFYETGHDPARLFTATECKSITRGQICKVALNLRKLREPKGEITVHVWSNYKKRPAALLTSSAGTIDASQISDGWYEVPINFNALPGEIYWVGYTLSKMDPKNGVAWLGGGSGARCYSADGITWVYSANEALNVRLYN
jgi:hypothetical protein